MYVLFEGYLKVLKKYCEVRGMFLIVDEVQIGIGCCGDFVVVNYEGVVFDILIFLKILGNGFFFSVVVISNEINVICIERDYFFYMIYVNDFLFVVVGDKVLEIVFWDNLIEKVWSFGLIF